MWMATFIAQPICSHYVLVGRGVNADSLLTFRDAAQERAAHAGPVGDQEKCIRNWAGRHEDRWSSSLSSEKVSAQPTLLLVLSLSL